VLNDTRRPGFALRRGSEEWISFECISSASPFATCQVSRIESAEVAFAISSSQGWYCSLVCSPGGDIGEW